MRNVNRPDLAEPKKPSVMKRILVVLLVTAILLSGGLYGALYVLFEGPFVHAAAAFVQDVGEMPVMEAALGLFLTPEEVDALRQVDPGTGITNGEEKMFSVYP